MVLANMQGRSVFMWYMWRVEDVDISTFDN